MHITPDLVWLILLLVFVGVEAATVGLVSIWFAIGALGGLICALSGGTIWMQIIVFILLTGLSLLALRPVARKFLNTRVEPTNADRVIGQEARVTQDIDNIRGMGTVSVGGITWTARSAHDTPIRAGTIVRVLRIEGVKVVVEDIYEKKEET